jgi:hypothetical protein
MYQNTAAEFRPELYSVVEEAMAIDKKFIADLLFPIYPVRTRTGDYKRTKRGKGQLLVNMAGDGSKDPLARAPGTAYPEISRTTEKASWSTVDRGITTPVDDVNAQDAARFFDMEAADAKWLMRVIRIYREVRVAYFINNETTWGKIEATTAFTEANIATFDAPALIKEGKRLVDKRQEDCNTLTLSRNLWDLVSRSTKMLQYCFGQLAGQSEVTLDVVAKKFGLGQICVGEASYDTTKPGKNSSDDNLQWAWGDKYMWLGNVQGGAPENGGAGRTFVLEDLTNGGQLFVPETWREEKIRSNQLRVRQDCEENTVNENCGLLIQVNDL